MTFKKVFADLGHAFAPGQVYVALSRCTSLKGLVLKTIINRDCIKTDKNVIEFALNEIPENLIVEKLKKMKEDYVNRKSHEFMRLTKINPLNTLSVKQKVEEKWYHKRIVLAAYIINQSLDDTQFGNTKFEKILHLSDYHAIKRNFNQNYLHKAAGPFDNKFTYGFFEYINKNKWFQRYQRNRQYFFEPGPFHSESTNLYDYFSNNEFERVSKIIRYFKNYNFEQPEIISTLYAVWNNRIILQENITDDLLIEDFYCWDRQKKKYELYRLENALQWMREEEILPDGWGKVIKKP